MTRRRWFWQAVLAVLCGLVASAAYWLVLFRWQSPFGDMTKAISSSMGGTGREDAWQTAISYSLVISLPSLLTLVLVYMFMVRRLVTRLDSIGETCCRKCGYILRGIAEPRCPECGERI